MCNVRQLLTTALLLCVSLGAQAVPILSISGVGSASAQSAHTEYLSGQSSYFMETFESFTAGASSQSTSISTAVGTFSLGTAGFGGACDNGPYACSDGPSVLDGGNTPFAGRYAAAPSNNWLDSQDAQSLTFSPLAGATSVGFYLTDANDSGGRLDISGFGFNFTDIFGGALSDGSIFYLTISDAAGLSDLTFWSNNPSDGYGIDNVTVAVASVPEPGTLTLLALGVAGLVVLRRRGSPSCP